MKVLLRLGRPQLGAAARSYARTAKHRRPAAPTAGADSAVASSVCLCLLKQCLTSMASAAEGQEPAEEAVHLRVHDGFYAGAPALRAHFDERRAPCQGWRGDESLATMNAHQARTTRCKQQEGFSENHTVSDTMLQRCRFRDPLQARKDRFCWDYWHVEDQCAPLHLLSACSQWQPRTCLVSPQKQPSCQADSHSGADSRPCCQGTRCCGRRRTASSRASSMRRCRTRCWTLASGGWAAAACRRPG